MEGYSIQKAGIREYATSPDGKVQYTRRLLGGHGQWELKFDKRGEDEDQEGKQSQEAMRQEEKFILALIRHNQADGEPFHWSLFVYQEGKQDKGNVFQVTGDATSMSYAHSDQGVDEFASESFRDHFQLAELDARQVAMVRQSVSSESPPSAPSRREVHENCQGWTLRVVRRLVDQGLVGERWLLSLDSLRQPV